jgi:hypothetical protein
MLLLGFEALTGWLCHLTLLPVLTLFEKFFFCRVGRLAILFFWLVICRLGGGALLFWNLRTTTYR